MKKMKEPRIISSTMNTEEVADMLTGEELMNALLSNENDFEQKIAAFEELVKRCMPKEKGEALQAMAEIRE